MDHRLSCILSLALAHGGVYVRPEPEQLAVQRSLVEQLAGGELTARHLGVAQLCHGEAHGFPGEHRVADEDLYLPIDLG